MLVSPGGWLDSSMTVGRGGTFDMIGKMLPMWQLDVQGTLPEDIKSRGVGSVRRGC